MDVSNASDILGGAILTGCALILVSVVIVVINNIFAKYWRPIKWLRFQDVDVNSPQFVTPEDLKEIVQNEIKSKEQAGGRYFIDDHICILKYYQYFSITLLDCDLDSGTGYTRSRDFRRPGDDPGRFYRADCEGLQDGTGEIVLQKYNSLVDFFCGSDKMECSIGELYA